MTIDDRTLRELVRDREVEIKSSRAPNGLPVVRVSVADHSNFLDGASGEQVIRKLWHLGSEDLLDRADGGNIWLYCWGRIEEIVPLIRAVASSGSESEWYVPSTHKSRGPGYMEQSLAWEIDAEHFASVSAVIRELPPQIASLIVWSEHPSHDAIVDMYTSTGMGLGLFDDPAACDPALDGLWTLNDWGSELRGVARRDLFEHWVA